MMSLFLFSLSFITAQNGGLLLAATAVLGITNLRELEKLMRCQDIINQSTASGLPIPTVPDLADLQQAVTDADNAKTATADGGKTATTTKNLLFKTMNTLFIAFTGWVQGVTNGDEAMINETGLYIKSQGGPVGILPAPGNVRTIFSTNVGVLILVWNAVVEGNSYIIQWTVDPTNEDSWEYYDEIVTKSKIELQGMESLKRVWARVAVINSAGRSEWSDPAVGLVS